MSHICPCPNPPGGQVVCSDDQLAMCGIRNGEIVSGCFDMPLWENDPVVWAVFQITNVRKSVVTYGDVQMLRSERYGNLLTGDHIIFRLPIGFPLPEW